MRILHTADVHLKTVGDERWEALDNITNVCEKENVDLLVISGDLFDTTSDAHNIRDGVRKFFSTGASETAIIPGNHDTSSFKKGFYFGEDVHVLGESNWHKNIIEFEDVRVVGLPFENLDTQEFYLKLRGLSSKLTPERSNIILYHGELLDNFYSRNDFGPGEERRYMPARLSFFKELNINYVLAGHFHTKFDMRKLEEDRYFVYSGSPVSVTRKETGQRFANLFDTGSIPKEYPLDTYHCSEIVIELNPFTNENHIDVIKREISKAHRNADVTLTIGGYINQSEKELVDAIKNFLIGRNVNVEYQFKDISSITNHSLYIKFEQILSQLEIDDSRKDEIRKMAIHGMIEAQV